jgi:hypothetical protein
MKNITVKMTAIMLFVILCLCSCKHETDSPIDEGQFCALVNEQSFEATGPIIDRYLETLPVNNPDENLQRLNEWFNTISCIEESVILCNSCIETYPPQSELRIIFLANGQTITLIMDVLMSEPLKYRTFHE